MGSKSQGNRGQFLPTSGTLLAEDRGVDLRQRLGRRRGERRRALGFTLLELLIVVIMIGVIVTLAIPSIATQMRDRRMNQAAHQVSLVYRQARALAMGRGSAVLVHFDAGTSPRGRIELREAQDIEPSHCVSLPATSCSQADWNAASPSNRLVTTFDPSNLDVFSN